jgi:phosphatidate cytidylyltransferase
VALAWLVLAPQRVGPASAAAAGILALVPAGVALMQLRFDAARGAELTLFAVLLIVAADLGAFFAGRAFGRIKLAPRVSPGKTWEGVFGGLLLTLAVGALGALWFDIPVLRMLPVCLAVAAYSVVGDLTESMLKRHSGIKDSGSLFPGHGGMLDRIDSICAGAPVLVLGLLQIEVIQ